jgi:hypothetical protein
MPYELRKHLYACYGSFADKRIKRIEKGHTFIGDTRDNGGIASDGSPYGWFCGIFVNVDSDEEVLVTLFGNIPRSSSVDAIFEKLGASPSASRIEFAINKERVPILHELADKIASIVAPGRRYSTPNYKYMCPRTAESLLKLAGYLERYWK